MILTRAGWLLVGIVALLATGDAFATCGDAPGDAAALAQARTSVAGQCSCDTGTHHDYVACADGVARQLVDNQQLSPACRGAVIRCTARSVCGKAGKVTCCNPAWPRCKITTPDRCVARGGCVGSYDSCCDACGGGGSCAQPPVCGNGVVESPEWCDGESFCESNCTIRRFACCEFATSGGACSGEVPAYTLFAYQNSVCGTYGGTFHMGLTPASGPACADPVPGVPYSQAAGACTTPPPLSEPIDLCCQFPASCSGSSTADQSAITNFIWNCAYQNYPNIPIVRGTCGGDGNCVFVP